jgi:hypothetical protein
MRVFLKSDHPAFDPEAVLFLVDAFNDAWAIVRESGGVTDDNAEAARLALAKRIVELAEHGQYDRQSLRDTAVASLAYANAGVAQSQSMPR